MGEIENALQELNQNSVSAHSHSHYEYNNMNNPQFVQSYSQSTAYPAADYALSYSEYNHPNSLNYIAQQQPISGFSDNLTAIPQQIVHNENENEIVQIKKKKKKKK